MDPGAPKETAPTQKRNNNKAPRRARRRPNIQRQRPKQPARVPVVTEANHKLYFNPQKLPAKPQNPEIDMQEANLMELEESKKDARLRPAVLHLYGTDRMSTEDIFAYFNTYSPTCIEWIDDSSCNVVFDSEEACSRVLSGLGSTVNYFDEHAKVPWYAGPDWKNQTIHFRIATTADVKSPEHSGRQSSFYAHFIKSIQQRKNKKRRAPSKEEPNPNVVNNNTRGRNMKRSQRQKQRKKRKIMENIVMKDAPKVETNNGLGSDRVPVSDPSPVVVLSEETGEALQLD
eukprot:TRINITY_DN8371_c0_g1_i1.p1 TRINITY_DN8371_c0_g1~~TRINITY_DN8371_c0_g1_i1.p1  ORF type:complete len:287 (+),score=68.20 TRINITY_DN8371_c0_g1_i1:105-965(+)